VQIKIKMQMHKVVDFRDSGIYKHVKLCEPRNSMPDEDLIRYVHHKYFDKHQSVFTILKNAHVFSSSNASVEIPLGNNAMYDGIYDIWLRNCVAVKSITLCFDKVEIPIPEFKLDENISIQIPLAFLSDGSAVNNIFANNVRSVFPELNLSFIPSIALGSDKLTIKLNDPASCDVCISTVYYQNHNLRSMLVHAENTFYVNGEPFVTRNGFVKRANPPHGKKPGCIIC
jgi:hypothetical protein